tara:strand:- start:131 stop:940 length:810 start_codon:yes stop_codon:yes gene_type:complete
MYINIESDGKPVASILDLYIMDRSFSLGGVLTSQARKDREEQGVRAGFWFSKLENQHLELPYEVWITRHENQTQLLVGLFSTPVLAHIFSEIIEPSTKIGQDIGVASIRLEEAKFGIWGYPSLQLADDLRGLPFRDDGPISFDESPNPKEVTVSDDMSNSMDSGQLAADPQLAAMASLVSQTNQFDVQMHAINAQYEGQMHAVGAQQEMYRKNAQLHLSHAMLSRDSAVAHISSEEKTIISELRHGTGRLFLKCASASGVILGAIYLLV